MDILSVIGNVRTPNAAEVIDSINFIVIDSEIDGDLNFASDIVGYVNPPECMETDHQSMVWEIEDHAGERYKLFISLSEFVPIKVARETFIARQENPEFFDQLKSIVEMMNL